MQFGLCLVNVQGEEVRDFIQQKSLMYKNAKLKRKNPVNLLG